MPTLHARRHLVSASAIALLALVNACATATPPAIRFAPEGTRLADLRTNFPLSDDERRLLTPDNLKALSQDQVDQIYARLSAGPIPDGPLRGDLFFPRDRDGHIRIHDLTDSAPKLDLLKDVSAMRAESLGRLLWKGKSFFRAQGIIRNRIEDVAILKLIIDDPATIPKQTFDGATTWLLFPAKFSCAASKFDIARRSITIDYSTGPTIEGYRAIPDDLAGDKGLKIRDEIRMVRKGFYLGRAYFAGRFGLNFTLVDPAVVTDTTPSPDAQRDCDAAPATANTTSSPARRARAAPAGPGSGSAPESPSPDR